LGLLRHADDPELVAASDDVCTGLQLVNFLQDVPRDLALGRIYMPADDRRLFGVERLDVPSAELHALLEFEAARGRGPPRGGPSFAGADRRTRRPRGRAVRARRARGARGARARRLGRVHAAPASVAHATRARGGAMTVDAAYGEVQRLTRKRARNFAYGIMVLPREKRRAIAAIYAYARRVDDIADGDLPPHEKRAQLEALRAALNVDW